MVVPLSSSTVYRQQCKLAERKTINYGLLRSLGLVSPTLAFAIRTSICTYYYQRKGVARTDSPRDYTQCDS